MGNIYLCRNPIRVEFITLSNMMEDEAKIVKGFQ